MLNVLLTIDTEVYPLHANWRADSLRQDIARDIYGQTSQGNFGLSFQLQTLQSHNLRASFFVESLFASAVGLAPLAKIVEEIQSTQSEIQLHLHPEWLAWMDHPPVPHNGRNQLRKFSASEQQTLISAALANLHAAGAKPIRAFRAGDYAANSDTLAALNQTGLLYDTSFNPCYPNSFADTSESAAATLSPSVILSAQNVISPGTLPAKDLPTKSKRPRDQHPRKTSSALTSTLQPHPIQNIWEFPISHWTDRLGNQRHAQLCSASFAELTGVLLSAHKAGWHSFVIVAHSFELLKKRRRRIDNPAPDPLVVRRFQKLCQFLSHHRDKFRTCGFNDIDPVDLPAHPSQHALRSPIRRTLWRTLEQAYRRLT